MVNAAPSQHLINQHTLAVAGHVSDACDIFCPLRGAGFTLLMRLEGDGYKVASAVALTSVLSDVVDKGEANWNSVCLNISRNLGAEIYLAAVRSASPAKFDHLVNILAHRSIGKRPDLKPRQLKSLNELVTKVGLSPKREKFDYKTRLSAGAIMLRSIIEVTGLFEVVTVSTAGGKKKERIVRLTDTGLDYYAKASTVIHVQHPPQTAPPLRWEPGNLGYSVADPRPAIRNNRGKSEADEHALDVLNSLQADKWRIIPHHAEALNSFLATGGWESELITPPLVPSSSASKNAWSTYYRQARLVADLNHHTSMGLIRAKRDAATAKRLMATGEPFYFGWDMDYRGRMFIINSPNPQQSKIFRHLIMPDVAMPHTMAAPDVPGLSHIVPDGRGLAFLDYNSSAFQLIAAITGDRLLAADSGLLPHSAYDSLYEAVALTTAGRYDPKLVKSVMTMMAFSGTEWGMQNAAHKWFVKQRGEADYRYFGEAKTAVADIRNVVSSRYPGIAHFADMVQKEHEQAKSIGRQYEFSMEDFILRQGYRSVPTKTVTLLSGAGKRIQARVPGATWGPNWRRHRAGLMPNLIHSLEARMARNIVRQWKLGGAGEILPIHDSFGVSGCQLDSLQLLMGEMLADTMEFCEKTFPYRWRIGMILPAEVDHTTVASPD